jgi:sulfofructose kinase
LAEAIDVLCAGFACHDLVFSVERHPGPDEKMFAPQRFDCGGGPAANAACAAARLGVSCVFAGYLGNDHYGRQHIEEMERIGIKTDLIVTGDAPTPLSVILVKPDGRRTVINYKGSTSPLAAGAIDTGGYLPAVILLDGHQPWIGQQLVDLARRYHIPTVLDAGSLHAGTEHLVGRVDYVVASEMFARQISGQADAAVAARKLHRPGAAVVVTLGAEGLVWHSDAEAGRLAAFEVDAVDTTGAGDAFHGAFAAGLARGLPWHALLRYASAAAALCCCKFGARLGMPSHRAVSKFIENED